jgi:hypothetical protein
MAAKGRLVCFERLNLHFSTSLRAGHASETFNFGVAD